MKASELRRQRRILYIGGSATGKTRQLGTWVQYTDQLGDKGSSLVITADADGLDTFQQMGVDPDVILVEDWGKIWTHLQQIREWAAGPAKMKALLLDDLGALQEVCKEWIASSPWTWEEIRQKQRSPTEFATQIEMARLQGKRQFQHVQWGQLLGMEDFLRKIFKELEVPFRVLTVREQLRRHPRSEKDHIFPGLQGHTRDWLMAQFSLVMSTFVYYEPNKSDPIFCASSRPHPRIDSKDRYKSGRTWVNPTAERILAHIAGKDGETPQEKEIGVGV